MTLPELPPGPAVLTYQGESVISDGGYNEALRAVALAYLKALHQTRQAYDVLVSGCYYADVAHEMDTADEILDSIGPLPPLPGEGK